MLRQSRGDAFWCQRTGWTFRTSWPRDRSGVRLTARFGHTTKLLLQPFHDISDCFCRLCGNLQAEHRLSAGHQRPAVGPVKYGQKVQALQKFLGDRALGVAKTDGSDESQRDGVVAEGCQNSGLESGRAGEKVARVIEHDRSPVDRPDRPEFRNFVQTGNRHLKRGKTIGTDTEKRKCRLAAIDR